MHIGIDIRPLLDPKPSGVGEYTRELLTALFEIDRENSYHLFSNSFRKITSYDPRVTNCQNVHLHPFRYPNKLFNTSLRFLHYPKIDSLISNSYQLDKLDLFFMPNLNFIALSSRVPLILTVHDLSFEFYPSFFTPRERLWHYLIDSRRLFHSASRLIAVSEHTKHELSRHAEIPEARITTIYPGIADDFFKEPAQEALTEIRNRYRLPKRFILFLATLEERKNFRTLIEAFEILSRDPRFSDLSLVLAGRRSRNYRLQTADYRRIHFLDYIPREDRAALYRLAEVFVYPSYYEGFGLPPLEAMALGTSVVVSHTTSLGEVVSDAGLMVNPYDVEELVQALAALLSNPLLRETLSRRGRERAERFRWRRSARELLETFQVVNRAKKIRPIL